MMLSSWRLYSWMRLTWMSNSAFGSSRMPMPLAHQRRRAAPCSAASPRRSRPGTPGRRRRARGRAARRCRRGTPSPIVSAISSVRPGLHCISQRRGVMPLVLLLMRSGIEPVQVGEDRLLHQLGVQRRDAVDRVRADEGEVAHAHPPLAALVDQGDRCGSRRRSSCARCAPPSSSRGVDLVDDLHVARQQPLEQRHRPALQRLGQQRVVGVGDGAAW